MSTGFQLSSVMGPGQFRLYRLVWMCLSPFSFPEHIHRVGAYPT